MEDDWSLTKAQHAVVFWAFLQADCGESPEEYHKQLLSLGRDLNGNEARICSSDCAELETDGDLETDGHLPSNISIPLDGIGPLPFLDEIPVSIQQLVAEIREIGDQLEHSIIARSRQNLSRNILCSSMQHWQEYLQREVEYILAHGVGLEHIQQERLTVALTFTLVKGVCQKVPSLLRSLFLTALQYLGPGRSS